MSLTLLCAGLLQRDLVLTAVSCGVQSHEQVVPIQYAELYWGQLRGCGHQRTGSQPPFMVGVEGLVIRKFCRDLGFMYVTVSLGYGYTAVTNTPKPCHLER